MRSLRPRCCVVITAHNAAATIGSCLLSLSRQQGILAEELEIILVDDRSRDGTADAAVACGLANLLLLQAPNGADSSLTTRQKALDLGIRAAQAEFVLTLDADGIASSDWVLSMLDPLERADADAVAGPVAFRAGHVHLASFQTIDAAFYFSFCRFLNHLGLKSGVFFGNFAFRRSLYGSVGGFERIGFALTEDLAFARALHSAAARLFFCERGLVEVAACGTWSELLTRAKRISAGGVSALSFFLGLWMILLPVLVVAAAVWGGFFSLFVLLRFFAGTFVVGVSLLRLRMGRFLFKALFYECVAIAAGVVVMLRIIGNSQVIWGGVRYDR